MGVILGLTAAVCWGIGDFLITYLTRRIGTARAMVLTQTLSLLAWLGLLLAGGHSPGGGGGAWALALASGFCHVLGLLLTYRAFEIGTLSLVSPIASGFAVVTALLAFASGERPAASALAGAGFLFLGVVLATRPPGGAEKKTLAGVPHALGSALAFGVMFWMLDFVTPRLGPVWPLLVLKVMASGSALLALRPGRAASAPGRPAAGAVWPLALGVAAADTLAWIAFLFGVRPEYTTIVTALASLFSAVTVLLAWALLRERLAPNQWVGVAVILLGVLLVSV